MSVYERVLIIANVWPEPKSSAAGSRMMQLIAFFQSKNAHITFACTSHESDFQEDLNALEIRSESILINSDSFNDLLEDVQPSCVVFDRFITEEQFGWRVMKKCPDALRILNTEDLHFLRDRRQSAVKKGETVDLSNRESLASEKTIREISAIYRSDISLMVSETEIEILKTQFDVPEHLLHYMPLFSEEKIEDTPTFEERKDFVFIGNFRHEPNWDSIRFIKEHVWSLIRKQLPKAKLHVYGAYISPKVQNFHNEKEGFLVHGRAKGAFEVIQEAKVLLAPIRFGAGIKGKFLDAMRCGTPNITTAVGAEDMLMNDQWAGIIADQPEDIAKAAVQIYSDENLWTQKQGLGYEIIQSRYNSSNFIPGFDERIKELSLNLQNHRSRSFTSTLMQQQSVMSAHYMSLWIMEKDKNSKN